MLIVLGDWPWIKPGASRFAAPSYSMLRQQRLHGMQSALGSKCAASTYALVVWKLQTKLYRPTGMVIINHWANSSGLIRSVWLSSMEPGSHASGYSVLTHHVMTQSQTMSLRLKWLVTFPGVQQLNRQFRSAAIMFIFYMYREDELWNLQSLWHSRMHQSSLHHFGVSTFTKFYWGTRNIQ